MVTGPVVTVVTPTWRRPRTILQRCLPSVECQTYENIEHLVVVDGPDRETIDALLGAGYGWDVGPRRLTYLGRNWTGFSGDAGLGQSARNAGVWMASGDYVAHLDDDVMWMPHHLETLVALIEEKDVDFVTTCWLFDGHPGGGTPPGQGRTDVSAILHRPMVWKTGGGFTLDGPCGEGTLVERWISAGLTWAHHDHATYTRDTSRAGAPDPPL